MVHEGAFERCCALNVSFASSCWLSSRQTSLDAKWISAGRCQNLQALALLQPSKEHWFFHSNKLPRGSMDGENLASIFSPYKADPLIKSAKTIDQ